VRRVSICLLVAAVVAAGAAVAPVEVGAAPPPVRYLDPVFPAVDHTFDLPFSTVDGQELRLDFYEPRGDVATARPLLLWFHGGTFIDGDKSTHRDDAEYFARRGYAVASVNYRLNPAGSWRELDIAEALADPEVAPDFLEAAYLAFIDAREAVGFFRTHATEYRIDPRSISAIGFSAGAVTALNAAYMGSYADGWGQWFDPKRITGVAISYAGISVSDWAEPGEPPSLMLHGRRDERIPFQDAETYCLDVVELGPDCSLESFAGDHGITSDWNWDPVHEAALDYLYDHVITYPQTGNAMLAGRVLGNEFQRIEGATITALQAGTTTPVATTTSLADGWWAIGLPPGAYDLRIDAPGHVTEYVADLPTPDPSSPIVLDSRQFAPVDVVLEASCASPPSFPDVTSAGTSCGAVEWMVESGITTGYADGTFRPATAVSRQTFVAFLHRLRGSPAPGPDAPTFSDVPPGHLFEPSIRWAAEQGIVTGYADGTFRPTALLARQGLAAILYRLWGEPPGPFPTPGTVPVSPSSPFYTELEWLWSSGYEAIRWRPAWPLLVGLGSYAPTAPVPRMSVAAAFHRLVADFYLESPT
jgi:acetyl esterase/lipase